MVAIYIYTASVTNINPPYLLLPLQYKSRCPKICPLVRSAFLLRSRGWTSYQGRQGASGKRANSDFLSRGWKILIGWLESVSAGCSRTWWTVTVEFGGQLRWNSVDSCSGIWWTVAVEFGGQLWWNSTPF